MGLQVAVIGCGYWGKNLVRVFSELGVLRYVCDTDVSRQEGLAIPGEPPEFTDQLQQVLQDPQIPAVAVATPAATHYQVVRECLLAGKDVFVEKPLSLDAAQGQRLVDLAERQSRVLMVGHILRYGYDLERVIEEYADRISIFHIHGVYQGQDHRSLTWLDQSSRKILVPYLMNFSGSVSIEVFSADTLETSLMRM